MIKYYSKKQSNDKHKRVTHEEVGIKMRLGRGTGNGNQASWSKHTFKADPHQKKKKKVISFNIILL